VTDCQCTCCLNWTRTRRNDVLLLFWTPERRSSTSWQYSCFPAKITNQKCCRQVRFLSSTYTKIRLRLQRSHRPPSRFWLGRLMQERGGEGREESVPRYFFCSLTTEYIAVNGVVGCHGNRSSVLSSSSPTTRRSFCVSRQRNIDHSLWSGGRVEKNLAILHNCKKYL